jgi:hypothetical protein
MKPCIRPGFMYPLCLVFHYYLPSAISSALTMVASLAIPMRNHSFVGPRSHGTEGLGSHLEFEANSS